MYASALDCQGLYTFPNPLSKVPVGALLQAENLTANKDGTAESRRGFGPVGVSLGFSNNNYIGNIFGYQNRLLVQDSGFLPGNMWYDSTGTQNWTQFTSFYSTQTIYDTYFASVEANKNMYLVGLSQTTPGPGAVTLKMPAYNTEPIPAGVPPGLDGSAVLAGAGAGFLGAAAQCAYQVVFGYVDANGNLNLGNPSERILIVNAGGGSDNATITFTVPQGLSTSYFYQVYRTPQTAYSATPSLNVPPGAEPQLAAQFNLTGGQIAALSVTLTDVTPDVLLGAALYTNPSQQGSLQTNDRPPIATDACLFSQMLFYSNTTSLPLLNFSMISVGAPNGVQLNDTITVNGVVFTAKAAQNNASKQFLFSTGGTVSQNIDATARALINCINANANTTLVYAFYLSGYNQLPGLIGLQSVSGTTNFVVTSSRGGAYSPVIPPSGTTFISSTDASPNGLYVSKVAQPEAVPLVNLIFVGGGDQAILRVLPLRDRVIVIKTDGIFVVTGSTPQNLSVTLLDSTIICIARATARVLNNSVYLLSQQGVVSITESGVTIQSRQVEGDILAPSTINYTSLTFPTLCSAISYESERLYILLMPTTASDLYPTQAFCYNWVTNSWTHWPLDISFGYVNPFDNKLYIGRPQGLSPKFLYQERKSYSYEDYYDEQFAMTILTIGSPQGGQQTITFTGAPSSAWKGFNLSQVSTGIQTTQVVTSGSTWSAITNGAPITVECIGGGGGGSTGYNCGGGGGEYRRSSVAYVSGTVVPISVGVGGAGASAAGANGANGTATNFNSGQVVANPGHGAGNIGGQGGSGGTGTVGFNGGSGGFIANYEGAGGAGGPFGAGAAGPASGGNYEGRGGSGGGGGSVGGGGSPGGPAGSGGNNHSGSGGGAGGVNGTFPTSGAPGTNGAGGGGGGDATSSTPGVNGGSGGNGGNGTEWVTAGSGGGGGAGGSAQTSFGGTGGTGGQGGFAGGGGGAGGGGVGTGQTGNGSSGNGGNGVLVITYFAVQNISAIIDSVNVGANQVTIDIANSTNPGVTLPWVTGAATVEKPIPIVYQQTPMTGNFPHYMKIWGRIDYWFNGGNFHYITSGASCDVSGPSVSTQPLTTNVAAQGSAQNFALPIQTIIPASCSLARWIMPYLALSFARARFSCLGVTASYEIESDVSG